MLLLLFRWFVLFCFVLFFFQFVVVRRFKKVFPWRSISLFLFLPIFLFVFGFIRFLTAVYVEFDQNKK